MGKITLEFTDSNFTFEDNFYVSDPDILSFYDELNGNDLNLSGEKLFRLLIEDFKSKYKNLNTKRRRVFYNIDLIDPDEIRNLRKTK